MVNIKKFVVNGEEYYSPDVLNLYDVIYHFGYNNRLFIVEYNKAISSKKSWKYLFITNQDKIEIISIVGGG